MVIARKPIAGREPVIVADASPSRRANGFGPDGFDERPSAPAELMPRLVGAAVHSHRYSTYIRERDLRSIGIRFDDSCFEPLGHDKADGALIAIFAHNACPVVHLGYIGSHLQRWTSRGTALGEVVYSLSLAPGESRNIAVIDTRRRQQTRRTEDTQADERLASEQQHTLALQEVAQAVALEHQFGKTTTEANTMVTGGAFVAAGAVVGGVAGGLIGTAVEPGGGTVIGAGLGAAAGVAAGGLVFAGANALGMIEAESSGDRDVMASTNQRIAQATSQQSALIRNVWSTVVTEDIQDEQLEARTSNVTNYNHMHALNMEYYEVLHGYQIATEAESAVPVLYLPFGALPFGEEALIAEFWDALRPGLSDDLQEKGHAVFVEPPPPTFVPSHVPDPPEAPPDATVNPALAVEVEAPWDFEMDDAVLTYFGGLIGAVADEVFKTVQLRIRLTDGRTHTAGEPTVITEPLEGRTRFKFVFAEAYDASAVAGFEFQSFAPADFFDISGRVRVRIDAGTLRTGDAQESLAGLELGTYQYRLREGRGSVFVVWAPMAENWETYYAGLGEVDRLEAENDQKRQQHEEMIARLDQWRQEVVNAIQREPYRFTLVVLSAMETGRLTWILDRLHIAGDEEHEGSVPLHAIAHTTPIGISGDSVLLRLKDNNMARVRQLVPGLAPMDIDSRSDLAAALLWSQQIAERFDGDNDDLTVESKVFLPGAGVFAEAILGRANGAEYVDPDRYWNWQDSPIPHQAPDVLPVSTEPRSSGPLDTAVTVPGATLPLVAAPDFPDPTGLGGVIAAVQNGMMFRDMSKAEQLTTILGGLADLAGQTAETAATMTGDAAADALGAATDIGRSVAAMANQLMSQASPQAAAPPKNPTTAQAATRAVENSQNKPRAVKQAAEDAFGVPGANDADPAANPASTDFIGPPRPPAQWRPEIDADQLQAPGAMSNAPALPPPVQTQIERELGEILDEAAETTGAMPDPAQLLPLMEQWYVEGVVSLLVFARSNEEYLNSAILQWADWTAAMQQLGLDDHIDGFEAQYGSARVLMRIALENAIKAAFDRMEANDDLDYALDVFNWVAQATQLGIQDESPLFDANGVVEFSPLSLKITDPIIPADIGPGQHVDVIVSGGVAIGAHPPLEAKTVDVSLDVVNGAATPDSGTIHPTLIMQSEIKRDSADPLKVTVVAAAELFNGVWRLDRTSEIEVA